MKKAYVAIVAGIAIVGALMLTAFKEELVTPEQQAQFDRIEDMVNGKLDSFRLLKDQECRDRAMQVAVVRADSVLAAQKAAKPAAKPAKQTTKKGTLTPKKPTTTTTPTTEPPKPAPATKGEKAAENRGETTQPATPPGPTKGDKAKERRSGGQ
jgi:hypothetical protein